jgi:hypothetical protein
MTPRGLMQLQPEPVQALLGPAHSLGTILMPIQIRQLLRVHMRVPRWLAKNSTVTSDTESRRPSSRMS